MDMTTTYTNRFLTTLEECKKMLDEYGVCVLPNILTTEECLSCVDEVWNYLEAMTSKWETPLDRNDKSTWDMTNFNPLHGMIIQHHHIGYIQPAMDIRQSPSVVNVFAHLFDTTPKGLLTSIDGVSISLPPEHSRKGWHTGRAKLAHCDTDYGEDVDTPLYQSWVSPLEVRSGDATLAVMVGSHKYHSSFKDNFTLRKTDFYKLTDEELKYFSDKGCEWKRILCPSGSMVIWDSRCVHHGQQPIKGRKLENIRMCFYVCMAPKTWASDKDIKKKVKLFNEMRMTTHDPIKSKPFAKNPRTYGNTFEVVRKPVSPTLTDLGRSLIGM